jgi:MAF protein
MTAVQPTLVLASTSPFRKALLERLGLEFVAVSPEVDETPRPGEEAGALVERLSEAKARAVADRFPRALIIGSDQVAVSDGEVLGKPGTHDRARRQLARLSGRRVTFLTGLCLLDSGRQTARSDSIPFSVRFRSLDADRIDRYLRAEQPYNCAGSFKSEGLGISLFESMHGDDPTALIGLPLIRLVTWLNEAGVAVP